MAETLIDLHHDLPKGHKIDSIQSPIGVLITD